MNSFIYLTKATFLSGFNINTKKGNQKSTFRTLGIFGLIFLGLSFYYNFMMLSSLEEMSISGEDYLLLVCLVGAALTLITSAFQMKSLLFQTKDYEILESMPLNKFTIIASKLTSVYLIDLVEDLIIIVPAIIFYLALTQGSVFVALLVLIGILFVSLTPLIISTIIGIGVAILASKTKNKPIIQTIGYIFFFIVIFAVSFLISFSTSSSAAIDSSINISNYLKLMPQFYLLKIAFDPAKWYFFLLFLLANILAAFIVIYVVSLLYKPLNTKLTTSYKDEKYVSEKKNENLSYLQTLDKKERDMVFKNPQYLVNSFLGPVFSIIFSTFMILMGVFIDFGFEDAADQQSFFITMSSMSVYLALLMNSMMTSTTASFSLEGKNIEFLMAYPLEKKDIINAKLKIAIIVPAILNFIAAMVFLVITIIVKCFNIYIFLEMLILPTLASTLISHVGLLCGLKWPKFHYENEMQVFKNSMSSNLTMLFVGLPTLIIGTVVIVINIVSFAMELPLLQLIPLIALSAIYIIAIIITRYLLKIHGENMFNLLSEK